MVGSSWYAEPATLIDMSFGDAMSLVAVATLTVVVVWAVDSDLREAYRAVRAAGVPATVAAPLAIVLAMLSGC